MIIVTNNRLVEEKLRDVASVRLTDGTYRDVLVLVRDMIHKGYKLISHPLMGSLKPNETPYRSIALSDRPLEQTDVDSLLLIEEAITMFDSFARTVRPDRGINTPDAYLDDFRNIDYSLIKNVLD